MVETHIEVLEAGSWRYHRVDWLPGVEGPTQALRREFAQLNATGNSYIVRCSRAARLALDAEWSKCPGQLFPVDLSVETDLRPSLDGVIIEWTDDLPRSAPG